MDRPVYCARCGSMVKAGDRFCGVCGATVSPSAPDAAPTREIPTQVYAPPGAARRGNAGLFALLAGIGVLVLLVAVIGVIFAVNLLGGEARTSEGPAVGNPPELDQGSGETPNASAGDEPLGVGDSVDAGGVRVTLNGVRTLPKSDVDQPVEDPDNSFLAADLTFENTSEEPVAVSSLLEFTLKDGEGYSASQTIHTGQRQLAEGNIAPGEQTSGEIVYEVPPAAADLQLDYTPAFGPDTYTWDIGDPGSLSGPAASATGIEPSSVAASSTAASAPDASGESVSYEPEKATDGVADTAWNVDGSGVGESITLQYDEPVTVSAVGIVPGYDKVDSSDGTYRFYQLYVIKRAEIRFSDGSIVGADFERDPMMQYTDVPEKETDSITITILEAYPPGDSPFGDSYPYTLEKAAISEIEVEGP